jgi:hypothetical protein
LDEKPIEQ